MNDTVERFHRNVLISSDTTVAEAIGKPEPYSIWVSLVMWILTSIFCVETTLGNLLVLCAYKLERNIRKHLSNKFIVSLAVSDLIIGMEGFPLLTVYVVEREHWPLGWVMCQVWLCIDYTLCLVSILTVLLITVDRYCSVCYPASYRAWQTRQKVRVMIILSWIIPFALFAVVIFGWELMTNEPVQDPEKCSAPFLNDPYVNMSMYIVYYWTTLAAMSVLYRGIHKAAKNLESKSKAREKQTIALLLGQRCMAQVGVGILMQGETRRNASMVETRTSAKHLLKNDRKGNDYGEIGLESGYTSDKCLSPMMKNHQKRSSCQHPIDSLKLEPSVFPTTPVAANEPTAEVLPPGDYWNIGDKTDKSMVPKRVPVKLTFRRFIRKKRSVSSLRSLNLYDNNECTSQTVDGFSSLCDINMIKSPTAMIMQLQDDLKKQNDEPKQNKQELPGKSTTSTAVTNKRSKYTKAESSASVVCARNRTPTLRNYGTLVTSIDNTNSTNVTTRVLSPNTHRCINRVSSSSTMPDGFKFFGSSRFVNESREESQYGGPKLEELQNNFNLLCEEKVRLTTSSSDNTEPHDDEESSGEVEDDEPTVIAVSAATEKSHTSNWVTNLFTNTWLLHKKRKVTKAEKRARKAFRTITVIVGTFALFWSPYFIVATIYGFCPTCIPAPLFFTSYYLCYLNSSVNPFAYAFANKLFRKTFVRILRGDFRSM